ncbi:MAG TPA: hypothetical protein VK465_03290, partial [Fibrobacteria bacterium]|nr:hypothetical protein [Fibrobacteria bacterium]
AYGVLADTLVAVHRYDGKAYILERGRLSRAGTAWHLSGRVDLAKRDRPMVFRMASREAGSMAVTLPKATIIEAEVRSLAVERIPYRGLDTLVGYAPRLTADFRWDRLAKTGSARVGAGARYKGETVKVDAEAAWDARRLAVERLDAALGTMRARASGAVRLHGRQFHELKGLGLKDLEGVSLEADRFDLAKAARTALPDPPLLSGTLHGRFAYSPDRGFEGTYDIRDVQPAATLDLMAVKEVRVRGDGDTLRILAVTVSEKEPLLNDSLSLILGGVLEDTQTLGVEMKAGTDLLLGFRGRMNAFSDLAGALTLRGAVQLPGKSGQLRALRLRADIATPFKDALANLKVTADTLRGEYVVPGLDTQSFSAPARLEAGRLVIPDLSVQGRAGTRVRGRVEYNLTGARTAVARFKGGSLVVQVGTRDKVQLRDLEVDLRADSQSVDLKARVGAGSFEHVQPPMRMAGDFSRVEVSYRSPLGKVTTTRDKATPARLRVSAVMDSSHLRYRIRGMDAIRNVFRGMGKRNGGGRQGQARVSRPLHLEVSVETAGSGNQVETDILRFPYVGNFSLRGIMPYALAQGRINGTGGELGTKKQAYLLDRLELKWLNAPLEEGTISAEASKSLKSACRADELRELLSRGQDTTCKAITRVEGVLTDIKFAYDTDCGGAFGSGADVTALLYSVRRGCWSSSFTGGGSGMTYEEQALALVEPFASQGLTWAAERLSGKWIESAEVSGLGAFASRDEAPR